MQSHMGMHGVFIGKYTVNTHKGGRVKFVSSTFLFVYSLMHKCPTLENKSYGTAISSSGV